MLIALAGLPATGKSTLAARLANELGGVVLSKDTVRAEACCSQVIGFLSLDARFRRTLYFLNKFRNHYADGRHLRGLNSIKRRFT